MPHPQRPPEAEPCGLPEDEPRPTSGDAPLPLSTGEPRPTPGTEPQWLSQDEQAAWLSLSGLMLKLPGAFEAQLQRDSGLSLFEYFVLSNLSMHPERTQRMSELAFVVNGSLSRLSNVVKRLEQRGLVRREPSPDNGRHVNAILTDEGWQVVVAAAPGHVAAVRHLVFDALAPGQADQLRDIGDRIVRRADPQSTWPAFRR
jgi:DNA-binding MarR family transcriptional regulator